MQNREDWNIDWKVDSKKENNIKRIERRKYNLIAKITEKKSGMDQTKISCDIS